MSSSIPKVAIIEDELAIRHFLRVSLKEYKYIAVEAATGLEGIKLITTEKPDLVILDLGLPDIDGIEVIKKIREWSNIPIIILSARGQESDKVLALDSGANDYVTKPFGVLELLARVRVALRTDNKAENNNPVFQLDHIKVDLAKHIVYVKDEEVHLTPIEYKLLVELVKNAGGLVSQQTLLRNVWGPGYAKEGHYLRIYMGNLRHKLEENPAQPRYLITEPGVGYRLRTS